MYPVYVKDVGGKEIENPVSVVKEQAGTWSTAVHFLNWRFYKVRQGFRKLKYMINETAWERWSISEDILI